jgi:peptidoglycan hydrolase-like amidase
MTSSGAHRLLSVTDQPRLRIGLQEQVPQVDFVLDGEFTTGTKLLVPGRYRAAALGRALELRGPQGILVVGGPEISLSPMRSEATVVVERITIGKGFHWQHERSGRFEGWLHIRARPDGTCLVVNEIPLESYVTSVISSEMSPHSPLELLKAHAVISRSWVLAQREVRLRRIAREASKRETESRPPSRCPSVPSSGGAVREIIRWTDREIHDDFDVCADDHCQRYRGIDTADTAAVREAVQATRGLVLTYEGEIADARFSKCCGGMTEAFSSAWQDRDVPYLRGGQFDGEQWPSTYPLPLSHEDHARTWIEGHPPAYCSLADPALRAEILSPSDRETRDFYRWETSFSQDELRHWIATTLDHDVGAVCRLEPLCRGVSGRIIRLKIVGEKATLIIGKELEIRRLLSWTHLYSSAFIVTPHYLHSRPIAERFSLRGAGWGHGVGLCQIGAAVMAARGKRWDEILSHYFPGCVVTPLYG